MAGDATPGGHTCKTTRRQTAFGLKTLSRQINKMAGIQPRVRQTGTRMRLGAAPPGGYQNRLYDGPRGFY
eukprot:5577558-Lingulodinium_polyedra.AAC.1